MNINRKPRQTRGEQLKVKIRNVIKSLLVDPNVDPDQISVTNVARLSECSRVSIYKTGMDNEVNNAFDKKLEQAKMEKKFANSKKPKMLILEDKVKQYKKETEEWKEKYHELLQTLARVLINLQEHGHKLDVPIDDLLVKEVKPLAFKRVSPYLKRFRKTPQTGMKKRY